MSLGRRRFTDKTYGPELYIWSPSDFVTKRKENIGGNVPPKFYCTATYGSQGQDWITTYVYDVVFVGMQKEQLAYVECDYVR